MSKSITEACLGHPKFKLLVRSRGRISFIFSLLILVGYSIFVLGMAYFPAWMATPIITGSSINYGILIGLFMIIFGVLSSWLYMRLANRDFDVLQQQLQEEFDHE